MLKIEFSIRTGGWLVVGLCMIATSASARPAPGRAPTLVHGAKERRGTESHRGVKPIDHLVMVYTSADNGLERSAFADMSKLATPAGASGRRPAQHVEIDQLIDTKSMGQFKVHFRGADAQMNRLPVAHLNMSDPGTLERFVRDSIAATPAKKYSLVLQGHGEAGLYLAEHNGFMTVGDVRQVLKKVGIRLNILSLDSCLMSTLETHFEMRDVARYITADEDYAPWNGIVSKKFQAILSTKQSDAKKVVALAREQAARNSGIKAPSDITVVATRHVRALVELVKSFELTPRDFKKVNAVDRNDPSFENDLHSVVMNSEHLTQRQKNQFEGLFARVVPYYEMNTAKAKVSPDQRGISILKTLETQTFTKKQRAAMGGLEFYQP